MSARWSMFGLARGLLRRHVRRRAECDADRGERLAPGCLAHRLGDTEVGHQGMATREQHVVRLDVPMHHPLRVGVGQGIDDLDEHSYCFVHRQLALAA